MTSKFVAPSTGLFSAYSCSKQGIAPGGGGVPCWRMWAVWPVWAIFCTLGNHSKLSATINLQKFPTFIGNFIVKVSISFIFLVKWFLGNFYRHLAIFIWSHWMWVQYTCLIECRLPPLDVYVAVCLVLTKTSMPNQWHMYKSWKLGRPDWK